MPNGINYEDSFEEFVATEEAIEQAVNLAFTQIDAVSVQHTQREYSDATDARMYVSPSTTSSSGFFREVTSVLTELINLRDYMNTISSRNPEDAGPTEFKVGDV